MLNVMQFIFDDFGHWLGVLIMGCAFLATLGETISKNK